MFPVSGNRIALVVGGRTALSYLNCIGLGGQLIVLLCFNI